MRGLIARDRGHFDDAAVNMRQAISSSPTFWLGYVNLAGLLRLDGKLAEAEAAARKAVELAPKEQETHSALALVLMDKGDKDAALAEMKKGIDADPRDAGGHLELGRLLARMERFEDALSSFKTSAALNPNSEPLVQAAGASKNLKRDSESLDYLRQAAQAEPANPTVWITLGEAELARNDLRRANEAFTKAESLDQQTPMSAIRIANAYAAKKRFGDAYAVFTRNQKTFDGNSDFQLAWSDVLWSDGKKPEATAKLEQVLANAGETAQVFESAGRILEARGDISAAIQSYEKAVAADPRTEEIFRAHIQQLNARLPPRSAAPTASAN